MVVGMNKLTAEKCREQIEEFQHLLDMEIISTKAERHLQAYRIALPVLEQQEKSDYGWIEWGGGECPELSPFLEVRKGDGTTDTGYPDHFEWDHIGDLSDIIAYRVVQQERERGEE